MLPHTALGYSVACLSGTSKHKCMQWEAGKGFSVGVRNVGDFVPRCEAIFFTWVSSGDLCGCRLKEFWEVSMVLRLQHVESRFMMRTLLHSNLQHMPRTWSPLVLASGKEGT